MKRPLPPRDIFVIRLQREIGSEQPFRAEIQHVPETAVTYVQTLGELVDYFQDHISAPDAKTLPPTGLR